MAAQCNTVPTLTLYGTTTIARAGAGGGTSTVVEENVSTMPPGTVTSLSSSCGVATGTETPVCSTSTVISTAPGSVVTQTTTRTITIPPSADDQPIISTFPTATQYSTSCATSSSSSAVAQPPSVTTPPASAVPSITAPPPSPSATQPSNNNDNASNSAPSSALPSQPANGNNPAPTVTDVILSTTVQSTIVSVQMSVGSTVLVGADGQLTTSMQTSAISYVYTTLVVATAADTSGRTTHHHATVPVNLGPIIGGVAAVLVICIAVFFALRQTCKKSRVRGGFGDDDDLFSPDREKDMRIKELDLTDGDTDLSYSNPNVHIIQPYHGNGSLLSSPNPSSLSNSTHHASPGGSPAQHSSNQHQSSTGPSYFEPLNSTNSSQTGLPIPGTPPLLLMSSPPPPSGTEYRQDSQQYGHFPNQDRKGQTQQQQQPPESYPMTQRPTSSATVLSPTSEHYAHQQHPSNRSSSGPGRSSSSYDTASSSARPSLSSSEINSQQATLRSAKAREAAQISNYLDQHQQQSSSSAGSYGFDVLVSSPVSLESGAARLQVVGVGDQAVVVHEDGGPLEEVPPAYVDRTAVRVGGGRGEGRNAD